MKTVNRKAALRPSKDQRAHHVGKRGYEENKATVEMAEVHTRELAMSLIEIGYWKLQCRFAQGLEECYMLKLIIFEIVLCGFRQHCDLTAPCASGEPPSRGSRGALQCWFPLGGMAGLLPARGTPSEWPRVITVERKCGGGVGLGLILETPFC